MTALNFKQELTGCFGKPVSENPPRTHLVRTAAEKGCPVIDGLGMLVKQGVIGIRYWTGIDPDPKVMRSALEQIFG